MFPDVIIPDQLALTYLEALTEDELARQGDILRARRYHEGEHPTYLTDRLKEFLNLDADSDAAFRMNISRIVVAAVSERLIVQALECADQAGADAAAEWWNEARLDARQADIHEAALVDGETFLIVDWDAETNAPRFTLNPRYSSVEAGGDGYGCWLVFPDDDFTRPPLYGVKRWAEDLGGGKTQMRATLYYPDRVEKYAYAGGWRPYMDTDGEPWPQPWVDGTGTPLGVPVIHFPNRSLRAEAKDAWPLQDALNKTLIDLLASADETAFRVFVALGWVPTTDGKPLDSDATNALNIAPGMIVGTTKAPNEASFSAIDPADLTQLRELKQDLVIDTAIVTDTPAARFRVSGQVAAEGTLKEQDEPLYAKIRNRQRWFGTSWAAAFEIARKLWNLYGGAQKLDETARYKTAWEPISARGDDEKYAEWKAKRESLGIPRRQLWREAGYTDEQIAEMMADPEIVATTFAAYPGPTSNGAADDGADETPAA